MCYKFFKMNIEKVIQLNNIKNNFNIGLFLNANDSKNINKIKNLTKTIENLVNINEKIDIVFEIYNKNRYYFKFF